MTDGSPLQASARLMKLATGASVAVAGTLIGVKLAAWLLTDSVSLLSSLIDSLMDVAASLVNFVAVRHALQPPDHEHRFGHGKAEPLAGLGQAAFIAGSAVFLVIEATNRLFHPQPIPHGLVGIGVMVFAILLTIALVHFQRYVVRKTGSTAVKADALHYASDVMVNATVIVSIGLSVGLGWHWADPVFALGIALYILRCAWEIARSALDILMDREFADEERERIRAIVMEHPEVRGMHELRTRSSGIKPFIQFHLELDGELNLSRAHAIADEVEARIKEVFPGAEIIIHQDPEGLVERHGTEDLVRRRRTLAR
ncbi:MAG: cation diffusion facilitator family transporter [Alphaproteobacteria bacterium]